MKTCKKCEITTLCAGCRKAAEVKEDYHYKCIGAEMYCKICGIGSFEHRHVKGDLPKDFIRVSQKEEKKACKTCQNNEFIYEPREDRNTIPCPACQKEEKKAVTPNLMKNNCLACGHVCQPEQKEALTAEQILEERNRIWREFKEQPYTFTDTKWLQKIIFPKEAIKKKEDIFKEVPSLKKLLKMADNSRKSRKKKLIRKKKAKSLGGFICTRTDMDY